MKKIIITRSQLNEIYNTPQLKKIQRNIYKSVSDYCGKMHSDDAWQDVKTLIGMIQSVDGVNDIHVGAGEYTNFLNPEKGAYRDYQTTVETEFGNLYGYIRCHAAGTMDDIFKYYDMTISLYPDKQRDMEITEDIDIAVKANNNTTSDYLNALKNSNTRNDIMKARAVTPDVNAVVSGPKTDDNSPKIDVEVPAGSTPEDVMIKQPEIGNAITNKGAQAFVHGDGYPNESKRYTKKQVEQARLYEMRRTGTIMTKKELRENILGEKETIIPKLKSMNMFQALECFRQVYGDEALQNLSTSWDMLRGIVNYFYNSDEEKQQKFLELINQ
jgi:hypothetical protein